MVLLQGLGTSSRSSKWRRSVAPNLVIFMALAGHQHRVPGPGQVHGQADGLPAVRDHQIAALAPPGRGQARRRARPRPKTRLDLPDDGQGVLGAGVVAGHHYQLRCPRPRPGP